MKKIFKMYILTYSDPDLLIRTETQKGSAIFAVAVVQKFSKNYGRISILKILKIIYLNIKKLKETLVKYND